MINVLFALLIVLAPLAGVAQEATRSGGGRGYVRVVLEYKSMFPGKIQVLDGVCKDTRNIDCAKASIKANSESCQQKTAPSECKEARELLDTTFCMEGLVYEGRLDSGGRVTVDLCTSETGYGNMYVRNISNGATWTNYSLLVDGKILTYP